VCGCVAVTVYVAVWLCGCVCGFVCDYRVVFGERCTHATGQFMTRVGNGILHLPQAFKRCICGAFWRIAIMASITAAIVILVVLWREGLLF
jgi:hypothetical protein